MTASGFLDGRGVSRREQLFLSCLAGSVVLHAALLFMPWPQPAAPPPVEVDLTIPSIPGPGIGGMQGLGQKPNIPLGVPEAPKPAPAAPAAKAPVPAPKAAPAKAAAPVPRSVPRVPAPSVPAAPLPVHTLPAPTSPARIATPTPRPPKSSANQAAMPAAAKSLISGAPAAGVASPVSGSAKSSNAPGLGMPFGKGSGLPGGGGGPIIIPPRLLNANEILAALRRYYPENERREGKEGTVNLYLHIGDDGLIHDIDIAKTAGPYFDAAAEKVARLMRFAPAENATGPVPVKIAQPFVFKLTD